MQIYLRGNVSKLLLIQVNNKQGKVNNMSTLKGKVKWFNGTKGYGFIEREDKEKDVFVHSSAVREAGLKYLNEGDELTFEVENGEKGPSAVKLQKTS
ncbi:MAG: cold shock protein (CspA family) [Pelagibacterales bacterium]|jgi:CspA family cold shock protein|nr:cold shock protein (CspA family) [Pelagibacterales bacterium]